MPKLKFYSTNKKTPIKTSKAIFEHNKTSDGWELVEKGPKLGKKQETLEVVSFLKADESYIKGEEMRKRAIKMGGLVGQHQAEQMLKQANELPKEWRQWYLVFPGTVWRNSDGGLDVPCLDWDGGGWVLVFGWLGSGFWGSGGRLVRLRK